MMQKNSNTKKHIAIMQPTYLPWIGYFGLMDSVDEFIFLDSVAFARRSWQQRNRIKTANDTILLTVPVLSKGKQGQFIKDIAIDTNNDFPKDHIRAIELNYSKSQYFSKYSPELFALLHREHKSLAQLNEDIIVWLKTMFGITTTLLYSSDIGCKGAKADLLVSLCNERNASEYISPPGSKVYLDKSDAFEKHDIPVFYFEFQHPMYKQLYGEFVPYMSAIDLLFNEGPNSLSVIRSGYR